MEHEEVLAVRILSSTGRAIARALKPLLGRLEALEARAPVVGPRGEPGPEGPAGPPGEAKDGAPGAAGLDGVGINAPGWAPGVYREGAVVQHHVGQYYRAAKDTAGEPPGDDWQRVGSAGFRLTGGYTEGRQYLEGDLFMRDYGTFQFHKGEAHLWAGRGGQGPRGERGERGTDGQPGKDGRDGAVIEALEIRGSKLVLVQRRPSGSLDEHVADLMPTLEKALEVFQERLELAEQRVREYIEERVARAVQDMQAKPRNGHRGGA